MWEEEKPDILARVNDTFTRLQEFKYVCDL